MAAFAPTIETRGAYRYAELYLALGPQAIGVTGDNTLSDLIGRVWALELGRDRVLRLYQRAADAATWARVTDLLPPVFDGVQPEGRRRYSIAFDQSSRANVAYEDDGLIYLTRWDPFAGEYVQNVTVAGVDPVVLFDATVNYVVGGSDVVLFYLSPDRLHVRHRTQREVYATERTAHSFDAPVIMDRVLALPYRYQVLASDANGDPLALVLRSDLYPLRVDATIAATLTPQPATYRETWNEATADELTAAIEPQAAAYTSERAFFTRDEGDELTAAIEPQAAAYTSERVFWSSDEADELAAAIDPQAASYQKVRDLYDESNADAMDAEVEPAQAEYREV